MSARGVAVLLWWLSCCGSALWRYSSNSPNYHIFSTRSTIKLEYEGTSFSKWNVPETCHIKDTKSPVTELRCPSPGVHIVQPVVTGGNEEERYLTVETSNVCFLWYYKVVNLFHNLTQTVIIWVYDPESSEPDEILRNAEEPSLNSIILSRQLATLGQRPTIYTVLKRKAYFSHENPKTKGLWYINLPMTADDAVMEIRGNEVTFQDCFIADFPFLLTFPFMTIPEVPGFLPISSPAGSQLKFSCLACVPTFAVVVADMETFQTNDSFRTWNRVRVPPDVLSDSERHSVDQVNMSRDGIFFLINGVLYLKNLETFQKLGRDKHLPEGEIVGITSRRWCWIKFLFKTKGRKSSMAIWTENEIYLGYYPERYIKLTTTTELKALLNLAPTSTLTIHNVEYTGHPLEIAVFLNYCTTCTVTKRIYLVIYNEDSEEWAYQDFLLDVPINTFLVPRFLFSAMPDLVLWDKHTIYYYYQNFTNAGIIQTSTGTGNLSTISDDSIIHDIFLDYYGNIVAKMENNIMFYFKINIREAVKLHLWITDRIKSFLFIGSSGQVCLVYVFDDGTLHIKEYPLNLEVKSSTFLTKEECPYRAFHNNISHMFYFLDKGDVLSVWAQIVYPENLGLHIIMDYYGPKILEWKKSMNYEIALGHCSKTLEITFYQSVDYEAVEDYHKLQYENMGIVLIQLRPSGFARICPTAQKVFQIAVGCNNNKFIAVKGFLKKECIHHDFTYVIDKSYLRDKPPDNLKINYNWSKYGCPLRVDSREEFQPSIQLFDDNGFIEDIKVNFILWEIHGRLDYSFTKTMRQSGCLNEAQTWKTMIELNQDTPLEKVWGPENYKTCFSYAVGKPGDLSQPYEIINSSNNNHIYWPMSHSGMYVFRVKILDPNYSFCNLMAIFAIETYGAIPRPSFYLVASILFVLMLLFFTLLVLSYFQYMRIYRYFIYEPLNKPLGKQKKN
ncbi:cation channel sperm-associated auxiliary subunit epsilon [Sciurus carolinensis]|uniref:cation channel sperm-associated auxiliary subunit epsilon n=1 Tax=Sciurus carolinensis TaxID=30640 RepID=UPI001FB4196E|nr:cation channel sperm-associated auxiliary subunit epsilon [Sciurus carolinensis]